MLSATHFSPGPRLPAARPRRQSVASPAIREFEIRQADQWFALWRGQLPFKPETDDMRDAPWLPRLMHDGGDNEFRAPSPVQFAGAIRGRVVVDLRNVYDLIAI
jgi:hypothetical protein